MTQPVQYTKARIKELCRQKHDLEFHLVQLKKEIGLNKIDKRQPIPNTITYHPKYDIYCDMAKEVTQLSLEINSLRASLPIYPMDNFESVFVSLIKQRHSDLYESLKQEIKERQAKKEVA